MGEAVSDGLEIERKFLVDEVPFLEGVRSTHLCQGYIATGQTEVRLRMSESRYTLTCKRGDGLKRREEQIELSAEQFNALWPLTEGRRVDKTRYLIPLGDYLIELDLFRGELTPLALAEVEFPSVEASQRFVAPDYFGQEVTENPRYKNKALALEGLPR